MTRREELFYWVVAAAVTLALALLAFAVLDWLPRLLREVR